MMGVRALVFYRGYGSLWLEDATIEGDSVVGWVWDDIPYGAEQVTMNFPVTCIRKWEGQVSDGSESSGG